MYGLPVSTAAGDVRSLIAAARAAAVPDSAALLRAVAAAAAWQDLADAPEVLDRLDPDAVAREVLRSTPRWTQLPAGIVAVVAARHVLATAEPADRHVIRTVAAARYAGVAPRPDDTGNGCWRLRWARLRPDPPHLVLTGHDWAVNALTAVPLPDGRTLLASGGDDRTVRLWDPVTGTPYGEPLRQREAVRALAAVPLPDGRALLAIACNQQVRLWDVATGTAVTTLTGHTATVTAVAAVSLPDGRTLLATAGDQPDPTIRLWDPVTGAPVGVLARHDKAVTALVPWPLPDGRTILASGGEYGDSLQLHDPVSGAEVGRSPHHRPMAAVPLPDGRTLLAVVDWHNSTWFHEPGATEAVDVLHGHEWGITFPDVATAVPLADGRTLLVGATRAHVWLWDQIGRSLIGRLTGHTDEVRALAAVPLTDGRTLLASAGQDSTVRLWDPTVGRADTTEGAGSVADLVFLPHPDGRILLAGAVAGQRGPVLWDADTGEPADPLPCYGESVSALAAVPLSEGRTVLGRR